jgi:hypothetical protein
MAYNLVLNSSNVVGSNNNTYVYDFIGGNFVVKDDYEICAAQVTIPYSWYTLDVQYGNTCFWLTIPRSAGQLPVNIKITIEPGNYTSTTIVSSLTTSIQNSGINTTTISAISIIPLTPSVPVYINPNNGKMILNLYGATYNYNGTILTIDQNTVITFFDPTAVLNCNINSPYVTSNPDPSAITFPTFSSPSVTIQN